jgi:hypothetical protein
MEPEISVTAHQEAASPLDEEKLARARRRLEALKAFYIHLFVFEMVLASLAIVNPATGVPSY